MSERAAGYLVPCLRAIGASLALAALAAAPAPAKTLDVFGPTVYERGKSKPVTVTDSFEAPDPDATYAIAIDSGGFAVSGGEASAVTSAVVRLNGETLFGPRDFKKRIAYLHAPLGLAASNRLEVQVRGKPGSALRITITGERDDAPVSVPDLAGATHAAALVALDAAGLVRGALLTAESGVASGTVLAQAPAPGTGVPAGTAVDITLAVPPAGQTPPIDFVVDPSLEPVVETIPPFDDGVPRRLASLVDPNGHRADFVEDELVVITNDGAALDAFLARWDGAVLHSVTPDAGGALATLTPVHLVRVTRPRADPAALVADLRALHEVGMGTHRVSSDAGLGMLAGAAMESAGGLAVGLNWIIEPQQFLDNRTLEAQPVTTRVVGPFGSGRVEALAFDPGTETLYGADAASGNLLDIDRDTGVASVVGAIGSPQISSLAFEPASGILYGGDTAIAMLLRIDTATGAGTVIGAAGFGGPTALAPLGGQLAGRDALTTSFQLIDPTGVGTFSVGLIGFSDVQGMATDNLPLASDVDSDQLLVIDTASGAGSAVAPLGADDIRGLAFDTVRQTLYGADTVSDSLVEFGIARFTGPDGVDYGRDAFNWPYMRAGGVQNIGVTEAWRALELNGRLGATVTLQVIDGGITDTGDLGPGFVGRGAVDTPNPFPCSGGSVCRWHGTMALSAAASVPDNRIGAAGPGGPVVLPVGIGTYSPDIVAMVDFLVASVELTPVADVVNLSVAVRIPAALCLAVCGYINLAGDALRGVGVLLVASAGNGGDDLVGDDVDAEDCFIACWEEAAVMPCEANGVLCVGALSWNSRMRHPISNFSGNPADCCTVDLFTTFPVFVFQPGRSNPQNVPARVSRGGGTSAASPFGAGIAALVIAADPTLGPGGVEGVLLATAQTATPDPTVNRWVDARAAVCSVLPNCPPLVGITAPADVSRHLQGAEIVFFASLSDPDGTANVAITWTSDIDGPIGSGRTFTRDDLSIGSHRVTATATDPGGFTHADAITILVLPDSDGDGLSDADELALGTDPNDPDSDDDGLSDGDEVALGSSPLDADSDDDGLGDAEEAARGTDPVNADSDGDTIADGAEIFFGTDPLDGTNRPDVVPRGTLLAESTGDPSGAWLTALDPATGNFGLIGRAAGGLGFSLAYDAAGRLFLVDGPDLVVHDPPTGTSRTIGELRDPLGVPVVLDEISYNPADGYLYGIGFPAGELVRIDPADASVSIGRGGPFEALTFSGTGTLYVALADAAGPDRLAQVDAASGDIQADLGLIGSAGDGPVAGLVINRDGLLLAATRPAAGTSRLLAYDPATPGWTVLSDLPRALRDLTVAPCPAPCLRPLPNTPTLVGGAPVSLALLHLNMGDNIDIVVVDLFARYSFAFGFGDAGFSFPLAGPLPGGNDRDIVAGDFDGDGSDDVVIGNESFDLLHVLLNDGTGLLALDHDEPVGDNPGMLRSVDVDADGDPDIVVFNRGDATVQVLINTGGGGVSNFVTGDTLEVATLLTTATAMAVGDVDADGDPDIAVATTGPGEVVVFANDGGGGFTRLAGPSNLAGIAAWLELGDVDRDGLADLAVSTGQVPNRAVNVLRGDGAGGFTPLIDLPDNSHVEQVFIIDVTSDGRADLVVNDGDSIGVYVGDGAGGFLPALGSPYRFPFLCCSTDLEVRDITGDGIPDLVFTDIELTGFGAIANDPPFGER